MKAVIQRVKHAKVVVAGETVGEIGPGILTLLGVARGDTEADLERVIQKILKLRIFEDAEGKMNLSLLESGGSHLIVSQFTLLGDTRKGNRPGFADAAPPDVARALYEKALTQSRALGARTEGGRFQADMQVSLLNDGPVTFVLSSKQESDV
jgi:D-tyrosyl-tRNA(Tyr) deacylase